MRNWYTMKAEDKTAEIVIYDEIGKSWWGEDTVSAKQFLDDLNALGDVANITLRVNSPGGDVFDGVAIHNAVKNHKAKVTAHVDGIAASAASFIVMAADSIVMPANTFLLIHGASGMSWGNADDMRAVADDLDRIDKSLTATYVARAGSTTAKVKALMKEDRLMDAAEAKQWGFADEVTSEKKMAASFPLRLLPEAAAKKFRAVAGDPEKTEPEKTEPEKTPPEKTEPEKPAEVPAEEKPPVAGLPGQTGIAGGRGIDGPTGVVITLDAAKKQGIEEHKQYVATITDLCTLASAKERVGAYVRASTPVEQVRKELLDMRAAEPEVLPHHPLVPASQVSASAWSKITDKINARLKK